MMQSDGIDAAMKGEVAKCKSSTKLQDGNQTTPYSGHGSASDGGSMNQGAAGPGAGSPGK